jgi:adenine-specific DNA-methyltransferase
MTDITALRNTKLAEAKALLKAFEMPPAQRNDRSAWVLLSLANIKPTDQWSSASAPLLPTVTIMQFIRKHYGKDYAPNSRETIRRQTLHQFEQARIVDRNKDDPSRPTNSKDNNYSLTEPILKILRGYPSGDWEKHLKQYLEEMESLKDRYRRRLEKEMIPIKLSSGDLIKLSPGKHNQLHADIVHQFCPRFIGEGGIVLYLGDTASSREEGGKLMVYESEYLKSLGIPIKSHEKLPDIVVFDKKREWLFLIEAVTSHGPISTKRWIELEEFLSGCKVPRVYVTAFPDKAEFRKNASEIAWETEVWIADRPDHMVHFNGEKFLGPYKR